MPQLLAEQDSASKHIMKPEKPVPFSNEFQNTEEYVNSLLDLVGSNDLLRLLCGGVHVLDFFTSTPDLYSQIIPQEWRDFFSQHDMMSILDLLMRDELPIYCNGEAMQCLPWQGDPSPPESLLFYIQTVRKHLLNREPPPPPRRTHNRAIKPEQKLTTNVAVGMNVKKRHEVGLFALYIADLTTDIKAAKGEAITHLVDFGSVRIISAEQWPVSPIIGTSSL